MNHSDSPAAIPVYGTAWIALACWACSNWSTCAARARLFWTLGCLANLGHILLALHIRYGWDQELAYTAIARQTFDMTGLDSGIGLYINYVFTVSWLLDTAFWWLRPALYESRSRWLDGLVQFMFFFMFFNATAIFGRSSIRFLGGILCVSGAIGWLRGKRTARSVEQGGANR